MRREPVWATTATLTYCLIRSNRLTLLTCQRCRNPLEIHQPSVDQPHQFLATCPECGAWFRLETRAGEAQGVMVSMPEATPLFPTGETIPSQPI